MLTEKIIKAVSDDIPNKLGKEDIVNDLTTGGVDKVLSAEQGKTIKALRTEVDAMKESIVGNKPIVISNDTPVGAIAFVDSKATDIEGWLVCDGRLLDTTEYSDLFSVIGYTHGGSDSQFALPNIILDNLVVESIDNAGEVIDGKVVKNQVGIIKAKKLGEDMFTVAQEVENAKGIYPTLRESLDNKASKSELEAIKDQVVNNRPIIITDDYPIGGFMWFTSLTAPEGWLMCNGQGVNISDFPELFEVIGYTYGGEGTWFRVPDLTTKQDFIRSVSATGKVGERQEDSNKLHNHIIGVGNPVSDGELFSQWHAVGVDTTGASADKKYYSAVAKAEGGSEARPKNIALAPFIKAKQRVADMATVAQEWTRFKENGGNIGGDTNIAGDSYATRHVGGYDTQDKRYRISIDSYGDFAIQKITKSGEFLFNIIRDSYNDKGLGNIGLGCANLYFGASAVSKIGYSKLPNGLLIQWGRFGGSFSNGAYKQNIQFPVAFTTATPSISMSLLSAGGYDETEVITHATYPNQNQFALAMKQVGSDKGNHAFEISWIAIGY